MPLTVKLTKIYIRLKKGTWDIMAKPLNERKKVILALMKDKDYIPMKEKELAIMLQLPKERREELTETLNEL